MDEEHVWRKQFRYDPIPSLVNLSLPEVAYFTRRDLLDEPLSDVRILWDVPLAQKIIKKQQEDGSFAYPNPKESVRSKHEYDLLETYRNVGFLVEMFGCDKRHAVIEKAKQFLLSFQSKEGDIRGIYWNQYSPNYTAGILELLIKAGYGEEKAVINGLEWLLSIRQHDGGWAVPIRTYEKKLDDWMTFKEPLMPNALKPFSWMVTGVVLRAFAAHTEYRHRDEVIQAAELVLSRVFQRDSYPDRSDPSYWTKFSFPFWFSDLISIFDSVSHIGIPASHVQVKKGLEWFIQKQEFGGEWHLQMLKGDRTTQGYWHALNICRIFKRFYS